MKNTVAILYGFAEGQKIGEHLTKVLTQDTFILTKDSINASVIIAHSGGIFLVPQNTKAQTLIFVAPSIGDVSLLGTQLHKTWIEFHNALTTKRLLQFYKRSLWNCVYLATRNAYHSQMMRAYKMLGKKLPNFQTKNVFVITNNKDPWSKQLTQDQKKNYPSYTFITMDGTHDDLWINPENYIKLLGHTHQVR